MTERPASLLSADQLKIDQSRCFRCSKPNPQVLLQGSAAFCSFGCVGDHFDWLFRTNLVMSNFLVSLWTKLEAKQAPREKVMEKITEIISECIQMDPRESS